MGVGRQLIFKVMPGELCTCKALFRMPPQMWQFSPNGAPYDLSLMLS